MSHYASNMQQAHQARASLMNSMVKNRLAPFPGGGVNPSYTPLDAAESARNYKIAASLRQMAHVNNTTRMRVVLPKDGTTDDSLRKAQAARQAEWYRQSAMPWGNAAMFTPTDRDRLSNPAQYSAVRQRQLTIPNTIGQFYAFMQAMSAAFGSVQ